MHLVALTASVPPGATTRRAEGTSRRAREWRGAPWGILRRAVRPAVVPALALLAAAGLGACGGKAERVAVGPDGRPPAVHAAPPVGAAPAPGLDPRILPPKRIPTRARRPVDPGAKRVIESWLKALRDGHLAAAARHFAVPLTFQNGTPVEHLTSRAAVRLAVGGFPCGAVAYKYGAAGRYTLVRFRLTERKGDDCHGAAGHTTGGALRVEGGRIREWYRLYDPEEVHPAGPLVDPGQRAA